MSLQAHSLSLAGTTITNIAHNSALLAFSNTHIHCAPKLPSVTLWGQRAICFRRLTASGAHTLHGMPKLSTIILFLIPSQPHVQCSWLQHCHDTHMAGGVIQAVQMLTRDLHMQTRSFAEWELTGTRIAVQTCKHIRFALIGLLIPFAVTVAAQAVHVPALVSISLFQSILKLTKAAHRKRMRCSILHYLSSSVLCVVCTLNKRMGQRTC